VKKRRTPPPPRGFDVDNNGAFQYPPFWLVYLAAKNRVPKASIKDCGAPDDRMSASCLQGIIPQRLIMRAAAWRQERSVKNGHSIELSTYFYRYHISLATERRGERVGGESAMRPDVPWKSVVIPTPSPHFNPIGCFSLASLPQSAKFKSVLKDRMTPRELIAGAPASVRRNKEKSAGSRHRHKGGHHHARQGPQWKSI
jgi:hypothetical protein